MSTRSKDIVGLLFRLVLAGILGYAGLIKMFEPGGARTAILAYRIFPPEWAQFLGWAMPAGEILLALLLVVGLFTRWAAIASGVLMAAFIVGIISVWVRGYSIDCGCFGGGGDIDPSGRDVRYATEIARDLLFAGMAAWLAVRPRSLWSLDRVPVAAQDEDTVYAETSDV